MKFDVIIGNPPYQDNSGAATGKSIWADFVKISLKHLNPDGYLSLIHPGEWRNVTGNFKPIQNLILSKQLLYLNMNSTRSGKSLFGVNTTYDVYCLKNTPKNGNVTNIVDYDNNTYSMCLDDVDVIPNINLNYVYDLIAKPNESTVELLSDSSYHHTRNYVNKTKTDVFKYPCVYTVGSLNVGFKYSSTNKKGHFGIPKVIWGNGLSDVIIDDTGQFGLTQFAYAIVDEPENLKNIKKALKSEKFIRDVMGYNKGVGHIYNKKLIGILRKDFWKEFINNWI